MNCSGRTSVGVKVRSISDCPRFEEKAGKLLGLSVIKRAFPENPDPWLACCYILRFLDAEDVRESAVRELARMEEVDRIDGLPRTCVV